MTNEYWDVFESEYDAEGDRIANEAYHLRNRYEKERSLNWISHLNESDLISVGMYARALDSLESTPSQLSWFLENAEKYGLTEQEIVLLQRAKELFLSVAKLVDEIAALGRDSSAIRDASVQCLEFVESSIKPIRTKIQKRG